MISSIDKGLCVLVGIHRDDTKKEMDYIAKKILSIRLFDDPQTGKRWNKSVKDLDLEVLCVSQFTLHHILKVRNVIIFIHPQSTLKVPNAYNIQTYYISRRAMPPTVCCISMYLYQPPTKSNKLGLCTTLRNIQICFSGSVVPFVPNSGKIQTSLNTSSSLFRNKRFMLNKMFQQNSSKFAIFYV